MASIADTRASLILRLADARDVQAWDEFTRVYEPVVYRLARKRGLQHVDAEEVVQETLAAVARTIDSWTPDPLRGRFRDWLGRISRNLTINVLTRHKHQVWGTGDTNMQRRLEAESDSAADVSRMFEAEYRREVFRFAAERVRRSIKETTWQAFWMTAIEGVAIPEAASKLGLSVGSVYIARSRAMARLREAVARYEESQDMATCRG
jgi:RNA polymerase sigma-70 factor (ECF subfamily)